MEFLRVIFPQEECVLHVIWEHRQAVILEHLGDKFVQFFISHFRASSQNYIIHPSYLVQILEIITDALVNQSQLCHLRLQDINLFGHFPIVGLQ